MLISLDFTITGGYMKKLLFLLVLTSLVLYSQNAYARNGAYYSWLTVGYGYSQSVGGSWSSYGPLKLTIGGLLWNYVGMELAADTSWDDIGNNNNSWTLDLKPYVLIQSTLGNRSNALIPYVGIAPVFSIAGIDYENKEDTAGFDVGVAAKGGLRVRLIDALMLGVGIEYVYHHNDLPASRNMSQFNAMVEVGFSW